MTIYWSSTKSPVHLFPRAYESEGVAKHVAENAFIDAAMLADELRIPHLNTWAVEAYQRRLGARKVSSSKPAPRPRVARRNQWTADDLERLKDLYPVISTEDLRREFHPRTIKAIRLQAALLKIKRARDWDVPKQLQDRHGDMAP